MSEQAKQKLPVVDENYTRAVFDSLGGMEVSLDGDPILFGPKRLNGKVALCRQHLSRCQQIYLQVSDDLHQLHRAHRQTKVDFDLQMQDLFANDIEVRSGKNIRDREAVATMKLRAEREAIAVFEAGIQDLEAVMTVVKAKREDLKDIQGRIRDQVKLCQEEIGLGARWGSAPGPGEKVPDLSAAPRVNVKALERMNAMGALDDGESSISDLEKFVQQETGVASIVEDEEDDEDALLITKTPEVPAVPAVTPPQVPAVTPQVPAATSQVTAAPVPQDPVIKPTPVVEAAEPVLPQVAVLELKASSTSSASDLDQLFNDLDVDPPSKKTKDSSTPSPSPMSTSTSVELDIDDLLNGV